MLIHIDKALVPSVDIHLTHLRLSCCMLISCLALDHLVALLQPVVVVRIVVYSDMQTHLRQHSKYV
jgi:hypothetical protein